MTEQEGQEVADLRAWIEHNVASIPGPDGEPPSPAEQARRWERMQQITAGVLLAKQAECHLKRLSEPS